MSKIIVHIDLNAFFVRCEEIKNPSLINKPVAIGHEGRAGIVSTCSYTARKYGVHSGQPMFQAKRLCPNIIIKEVDFPFYKTKSKEFYLFVKKYTSIVVMASIDECYCDFTDVLKDVKDPISYFKNFQKELFDKTKLHCSIGLAPTKFLAKMGSDYKKPDGFTIIRIRDLESILYPIPIENMYGIGKKSAPRLKAMGINTIGDLAKRFKEDEITMKDFFGVGFDNCKACIFGYSDDVISLEEEDAKSIGNSTTLYRDSDDYEEIKETLKSLAEEVSLRAKNEMKYGKTVTLVVKDSEFNSHTKSKTLSTPIIEAYDILDVALDLYAKSYQNLTLRLVGITLSSLIDFKDMVVQLSLFDYDQVEEKDKTRLIINEINKRLKKQVLKRASEVKK